MTLLGSQFIAHPPIQPFRVEVADPAHELVSGIEPFETDDELYLSRIHGDLHHLLETRYTGPAQGSWKTTGQTMRRGPSTTSTGWEKEKCFT